MKLMWRCDTNYAKLETNQNARPTFHFRNASLAFSLRLHQNAPSTFHFKNERPASAWGYNRTQPLRFTSKIQESCTTTSGQVQIWSWKPSPHVFEASSLNTPTTDLRNYLTRKMSVHQIAPQCHCEQFISAVLSAITASRWLSHQFWASKMFLKH